MPNTESPFAFVLSGVCLFLLLLVILLSRKISRLSQRLEEERTRQKSLSATYGRITEQWFPLMDAYPYDARNFRFLGTPIDGVQFEEDRIVFVEFKANRSRLSPEQQRIKELVEEGYVYWEAFQFSDDDEQ